MEGEIWEGLGRRCGEWDCVWGDDGVKKMEKFLMLYLTNLIQIVIILTVKEIIW